MVEVTYVNHLKPQSALKQSTKVCDCGNTVLVLLSSLNKKYCIDCQKYTDWYLEEGQKSPLTSVIGGPSTSIIQDSTLVESLPVGPTMNPTNFYVPLTNVTEDQIRKFCTAICKFHDVETPEEMIEQLLDHKHLISNPHIKVTHHPLSVYLITYKGTHDIIHINVCTAIYEGINSLPDELFEDKTKPTPALNSVMTVEEAALEYKALYDLVIKTANRLGIKPIKGGRLDNMYNVLQKLEENYTSKTLH